MMNRSAMGGYDRSLTMFSPDGRLLQVEYALEAVRRGTLAVGIKSKAGAVIVVRKKATSPLMDLESVHKVFKVDEHIGCAISGLHADSRILVDYARILCQNFRLTYDEPTRLKTLVKKLADIKQRVTQYGGTRPFGSALLFIAVDSDGPQCMSTSPSGTFWSWNATAMGSNEEQARKILNENYKEDADLDGIMMLGLKVQKECSDEDIDPAGIHIGYVDIKEKTFKFAEPEKIKSLFSQLSSSESSSKPKDTDKSKNSDDSIDSI